MTDAGKSKYEPYYRWRDLWIRSFIEDNGMRNSTSKILMSIALYLNRDTWDAFPSIDRLAEDTKMHPANVQRSLREAVQRGHLEIEARESKYGDQTSNSYKPRFRDGDNGEKIEQRRNERRKQRRTSVEPASEAASEPPF
jgi:hypothetical protein